MFLGHADRSWRSHFRVLERRFQISARILDRLLTSLAFPLHRLGRCIVRAAENISRHKSFRARGHDIAPPPRSKSRFLPAESPLPACVTTYRIPRQSRGARPPGQVRAPQNVLVTLRRAWLQCSTSRNPITTGLAFRAVEMAQPGEPAPKNGTTPSGTAPWRAPGLPSARPRPPPEREAQPRVLGGPSASRSQTDAQPRTASHRSAELAYRSPGRIPSGRRPGSARPRARGPTADATPGSRPTARRRSCPRSRPTRSAEAWLAPSGVLSSRARTSSSSVPPFSRAMISSACQNGFSRRKALRDRPRRRTRNFMSCRRAVSSFTPYFIPRSFITP